MPSQTTSPPLTVTVLAALWVSLGRCHVSEAPGPGCDNGKLYLDRDLHDFYWDCPVSAWPESTQALPSIDTVYDPEPARQICMDKSISYNHTIPNSGAYRPVRAESGEYFYCPPQRWLNNLHHASTVLLYHPCTPLHERLLLSVLAHSCLPEYIMTPHPQLNQAMPMALVSWGRTLELSTITSSEVCDWLETTTSTRNKLYGVSQSRKYNLLLTRPAEQHQLHHEHPEEHSAKMKESLRRCCEQTISSHQSGAMESNKKKENSQIKDEGKSRQKRAAVGDKQENVKDENRGEDKLTRDSSSLSDQTSSPLGPAADSLSGNMTLSDPPDTKEAPSQSEIQNINQGLTPRPKTPLGSDMSKTKLNTQSVGFGTSQKSTTHTAAQQSSPEDTGLDSKYEGTDSVKDRMTENNSIEKHSDKASTPDGMMKDNEVVDVKERELEHKQTHSDSHFQQKNEKTGDSVSKSQSESLPQLQPPSNPQPASYLPSSHDCDGCKAGERCECSKDQGVNTGLQRTPRTDEAVWAAAALGFLLVLLTLSVLHTRLYRHWRTTPSLYWHDPQQDYDSVADVIRRRLRIAKRRRKRGRRQECVLLPSSSSSDELP